MVQLAESHRTVTVARCLLASSRSSSHCPVPPGLTCQPRCLATFSTDSKMRSPLSGPPGANAMRTGSSITSRRRSPRSRLPVCAFAGATANAASKSRNFTNSLRRPGQDHAIVDRVQPAAPTAALAPALLHRDLDRVLLLPELLAHGPVGRALQDALFRPSVLALRPHRESARQRRAKELPIGVARLLACAGQRIDVFQSREADAPLDLLRDRDIDGAGQAREQAVIGPVYGADADAAPLALLVPQIGAFDVP